MSNSPQIRVSIDVGYRQHSVAVGLSNGELLDEFEIAHDPHGFDAFFTRIESHQGLYDGEIAVAMEGYNGFARPLDSLVQKRRWQLYNINNLKLARFKEIFPAAAKSDRIDARRALELFQLQDHLPLAKRVLQRVPPGSLCNAKLKRLTRRRRTLVDDKVQVLNRFQSDLQAVCPCLLGITRHADNLWFLRLITQVSTLPKLARLREKTLLKIPSIGRNYVAIIRQWQKRARFSGEVDYVGPMIIDDAKRILQLHTQIKELEVQCAELINDSPMAQRIDSIPGFATVCASELAGEIGTIERFAHEGSLAVYLGMANLDRSSGASKGAKAPRHVNTRAKRAMMTGVDRQRKQVPQSQRYYEKKRAEGKGHNQAIRALGRHLCRILFTMLKNDRDYETRTETA